GKFLPLSGFELHAAIAGHRHSPRESARPRPRAFASRDRELIWDLVLPSVSFAPANPTQVLARTVTMSRSSDPEPTRSFPGGRIRRPIRAGMLPQAEAR